MDQENGKVEHVEVSDWNGPAAHLVVRTLSDNILSSNDRLVDDVARKKGRKAVRPGHEPITEIVDVTSSAPPARCEESAPSLCLNVGEMRNAWVFWICSERVLLAVAGTEDVVTSKLDSHDGSNTVVAELNGVD